MRTFVYILFCILLFHAGLASGASPQAFFEQGMEAFKSGNYKNAELLFRKSLDADDENNDKAWFYLSRSIYSQKRYKDAIFEFNRFLLNCRNNELCTESRFWIAESQNGLSANIKAIEEYKRFMTMADDRNNPLVSVAHERIGDIYYHQNRLDEAILEWKNAVQKVKDRDDRKSALIMKLARALIANSQFDEAEELITPLSADKDAAIAAEANLYLGRVNFSRGKHRIALKFFAKIPENLRVNQPFSDMYYYAGISYSELGEKENMMNSLQTFVGIAKTSSVYYDGAFLLAKVKEAKNPAESAAVFEEVRLKTSSRKLKIMVSVELARIYIAQGEPAKAVRILEEFKSEEEGETGKQLQFELGSAYLSANMLEKSAELFTRMLEIYQYEQDVDRIQFLLSVVDLKRGDSEKAAEGFQRIREINPFSRYIGESYYYIAAARFEQEDYAQTIKYCEKYLSGQNAEKKYEAVVLQMRSYLRMGDFKKAEKAVAVLMYKYSDKLGVDRHLYEFVKKSYEAKRDPKLIESFILKNFSESDTAANIYLFKGDYEYDAGNWKKADLYYTSALRIRGNEAVPEVFLKKALCLFNQGDFEAVVRFLTTEKMNTFSKDVSVRIVVLLSRSYYKAGAYNKAYETIASVKDVISSDDDMFMYFELAVRTDNLVVAKNILNSLKNKRENYYTALFIYGEYYRDIYNNENARKYFSQVIADNPESRIGERSLLELAYLDMRENRYEDMLEKMRGVRSREFEQRKLFFSVTALLKLGRIPEAVDLFRVGSAEFIKSDAGRFLMRDMIVALSGMDYIDDMGYVAKILAAQFPEENDFVNYYTGNYYYKKNMYDKSMKAFQKISVNNPEYRSEILYKMGMINQLGMKNGKRAIFYFAQLQDVKEYDEFIAAARIELAILYYERGFREQSRRLLDDVMKRKEHITSSVRAANLYSYYGYDKIEVKK